MNRVKSLFKKLRAEHRCGLIAYVPCGAGPTAEVILALADSGADAIELGVPFSDPIADGPAIQRASHDALLSGTTLAGVLEAATAIRAASAVPLVVMSYVNPILAYRIERLAAAAAAACI